MRPLLPILVAALLSSVAARAQGIQVSPVLVELAAGQLATTIAVTNTGAPRVTVQVRPFAWEQAGDSDRLLPTEDVAVSPPLTDIDPGETQTFRIVARRAAVPVEAAYRLLVDQIPTATSGGGVQFALRLSIPVFLEPPGRATPAIEWRITSDGRTATLHASNRGNSHTRLLSPELVAGPRRLAVVANGNPYILPRTERSWRIGSAAGLQPGTSVRLTGLSDGGRVDAAIPVTAP